MKTTPLDTTKPTLGVSQIVGWTLRGATIGPFLTIAAPIGMAYEGYKMLSELRPKPSQEFKDMTLGTIAIETSAVLGAGVASFFSAPLLLGAITATSICGGIGFLGYKITDHKIALDKYNAYQDVVSEIFSTAAVVDVLPIDTTTANQDIELNKQHFDNNLVGDNGTL